MCGSWKAGKMKKESKEEVEYKQKSGTAWSHSYLNQKPWHPLSYPNQRRKWIAEQQHAQHDRKADEVAREVWIAIMFLSYFASLFHFFIHLSLTHTYILPSCLLMLLLPPTLLSVRVCGHLVYGKEKYE